MLMNKKLKRVISAFTFMAALSAQSQTQESPTDRLEVAGDVRLRHEYIETAGDNVRNRQRLRARLGAQYTVSDSVSVALQVVTGSSDPVSANQTLGDAYTSKGIQLNLANVNWVPVEGLSIVAGKQNVPFYKPGKSELIWDGDLAPEGVSVEYGIAGEKFSLNLELANFWVKENGVDTVDDVVMNGAQINSKTSLMSGALDILLGVGQFNYNTKGSNALYNSKFFGNSEDSSTQYLYNYNMFQTYLEVAFKIAGTPVSVFYDSVANTDPDQDNTGYLTGIRVGKTKDAGSWQVALNVANVEKDAVLGVFSDSDFKGGGTNGKGAELAFGYQVTDTSKVALTVFDNETSLESAASEDYTRVQLDYIVKF